MSDNKQSSIDWLFEQLEEKGGAWENASIRRVQISIDVTEYLQLKRQAKAMHKEEIKDSYNQGYRDGEMTTDSSRSQVDISEFNDGDIYYNYTFGDESNK